MNKKITFLAGLVIVGASNCVHAMDGGALLQSLTLPDSEFLAQVTAAHPEMRRLTEPVKGSPESQMVDNEHSPSKRLFAKQHIEFDRTAVGILALKWTLSDNYDQFVTGQPESVRLKRESFDELRVLTNNLVKKDLLGALVTSLAVNDLGKVIGFVEEVRRRVGAQDVDHDNILLCALQHYPDLVPSFGKLKKLIKI